MAQWGLCNCICAKRYNYRVLCSQVFLNKKILSISAILSFYHSICNICNTIILGRDVRQEFRQKMHTLYEGDGCDNDDKRELKLKYFLSVLTYRATYVLQINLIYKIISYQIMHGITSGKNAMICVICEVMRHRVRYFSLPYWIRRLRFHHFLR